MLPNLGKIVLASAIMGAAVWGGLKLAAGLALTPKAHDVVVLAGLIPLAVAVYGALLWLMKIEGREEVGLLLAKMRGKGAAT